MTGRLITFTSEPSLNSGKRGRRAFNACDAIPGISGLSFRAVRGDDADARPLNTVQMKRYRLEENLRDGPYTVFTRF